MTDIPVLPGVKLMTKETVDKKKTRIAITVIFFLLLALPLGTWPIMHNFVDTENYENRVWAEFPEISGDNVWNITKGIDDWFSDRIPYKNPVMNLQSQIKTAMSDQMSWLDYFTGSPVIVGKDDWLFYNGKSAVGESSLPDYMGSSLYQETELMELADGYQQLKDQYQAQGIRLILFIPPNKEQIYPELMPDNLGPITEYSRMDQFVDYMHENTDVEVIYAKDALLEAKEQGYRVFQIYDSHWNYLGSFVGAQLLRQAILGEKDTLSEHEIGQMYGADGSGVPEDRDLAIMMNLGADYTELQNLAVKDYFEDRPFNIGAWKNWDDVDYINYVSDYTGNQIRMLMLRDSFSYKMEPYMGRDYANIMFLSDTKYARQYVIDTPPDIVVIEIVERKKEFLENAWKEMML